ncbi:MAG TPA: DNA polymerase/3'-5' exonuclease PolX [Gemmatimonadales bacterium]
MENSEIAGLLDEIADLLELTDENQFRIRAYRTAARTIWEKSEPVAEIAKADPKQLLALPGIGKDMAAKIAELARTGRLEQLAELRRQTPKGVRELMHIPGLGPKRAMQLYQVLNIRTLAGLKKAAKAGQLRKVPGFGQKTEERILREIETLQATPRRTLLAEAAQLAEPYVAYLRQTPGVERCEVAGSYRRRAETVGDLDILVTCAPGTPIVERFISYPAVREVLARGPTRASVRLRAGLQVDLRVLAPVSYGAGLYYFTGSKSHNIAVRRIAQDRGLKINEYGVFRGRRRVAGTTEEEVFAAVGLPWIAPELRENRGEIEAAAAGQLPDLVTLEQIRGDLQSHSTDSDGRDSLEVMAEAAAELGYEYYAVTDHSPALAMVQGLDKAGFRRQRKRIDKFNAGSPKLTVLAGAEVDILADGSLDMDDETLRMLDLVVVSLHSRLALSQEAQTDRICRGLSHPNVDIFGHPSARLIGRRQPVAVDWERIYRTAADHGVMLEINAQPDRLDLTDLHARAAISQGIKLTLGSDAHRTKELEFMRWGVNQARRAWATPADIANTRPLAEFMRLLHGSR